MSDIVFDSTEKITVLCDTMWVNGHDLLLDSHARRKAGNLGGFRRALVHDQGDGLTINFNHDYPGGVTLNGPVTLTGDVTFAIHRTAISPTGHGAKVLDEMVKLSDIIKTLENQVSDLQARVAKLEAK